MKRAIFATIVLLLASVAWAETPAHGPLRIIDAIPSVTLMDTTSSDDHYRIRVDGDVVFIENRDAGGGTTQETWEFQSDGYFVVNDGWAVISTTAPGVRFADETVGDDDFVVFADADALLVRNTSANGGTQKFEWVFKTNGDFQATDGDIIADNIVAPSYGQMSIDDNSDSLVATTNTVWYPVIEYDETPLVAGAGYVTATTATGLLTVGANGGGVYEIGCRLSGQHSAAVGVGVHFAAFKNGSTKLTDVSSINDIPVQNKHMQNISFGMATLVAADTIECKVKAESTDTIIIDHAHIMINRISQ